MAHQELLLAGLPASVAQGSHKGGLMTLIAYGLMLGGLLSGIVLLLRMRRS